MAECTEPRAGEKGHAQSMTQDSGAGWTCSLKKQRAKEPPLSLRSHTGHLPSVTPGSACFSSVSISIF